MRKIFIYSSLSVLLMFNIYGTFIDNAIRTFEGRRIHITEVPFVVLVIPHDHSCCTGFIVAIDWVLTVAHCFGSETFNGSVEIRIGTHDQLDKAIKINSSSVIIHPNFFKFGKEYDIALIHLKHKIQMTEVAQIIQLEDKKWPEGELRRHCFSIGYGYHINLERIGVLHGGQVTAGFGQYPYECKSAQRNTKSERFVWSNSNESVHICYGDSGGPLVCDRVAVGVSVISFNCGEGPSDIHCGGEFVDAFLYLYEHLNWLQSYVSCLPSSCIENKNPQVFASAIKNLDLSLYLLIMNLLFLCFS
ncbi:serine protease 55-like [Rhodnius prolixus]|uniref:serine protease 55-like n=1 Tax=Rhodnius prolixus TaxID=13249 RepID=UPI003D18CD98